jgi:transcriptional regulator NrdR family protein
MRERQSKAVCPHCTHWDSTVMQGWSDPRGYTRRRKCASCRRTFKTRELTITPKPTTSSRTA